MEQGDCAVAFIAFGDEKFPAAVPVGVRPENRDFSADIMRWMQTAFPQHVRSHRGRRGFAVHSNKEKPGNSAHPAPSDANEVNVVPFTRQEFCKIDILRHDWVYFSIVTATRLAASRGARCEHLSDIRRSCSGRSIMSRIF